MAFSTGCKAQSELKFEQYVLGFNRENFIFKFLVYLPAAKSVPFAEPKVLIVTLNGISQASAPKIRLPNVTATASDSIISVADIADKYETFINA